MYFFSVDLSVISKIVEATPAQALPLMLCLVLVGYLSFKVYQEFKKVYQTVNQKEALLVARLGKCETTLAQCDERTMMLSEKLSKIETSLESINASLIRLSTTMEMHMKQEERK